MEKDKNTYIFKHLKQHLNYVKKNYPNYNIIYIALQGSQNYSLDIYTEEYKSDIDTKAIVVPSLEDIALKKKPISTTIILPDNSHCDVKDIRLMMDAFKKQNINFIEILFTKYRIIDKDYKDLMMELLNIKEEVAHYNVNQALKCISGMSMEKRKALCHPYPSLIDKIEKYGYDGKQLHHIIRMNDFIKAYTQNKSYEECLTTYKDKDLLLKAKLNKFSLQEAIKIADKYDTETKKIKDKYMTEEDSRNENTLNKMNNIQYNIVKRSIELEIKPKPKPEQKLDINEYENIFVTSDIHFCHTKMLEYQPTRQKLLTNFNKERYKTDEEYRQETIRNFNEQIVKRWNEIVTNNDLTFILGDLAVEYKDIDEVNSLISRLNGDKVLVVGNHDDYLLQDKRFSKRLFKEIIPYKGIKYNNKFIVMCHYPIQAFNKQDKQNQDGTNIGLHLYGHIHSASLKYEIPHAYNVGMDVNNYLPVNINEFIKLDNTNKIKTNHHLENKI